MKYDCLITDVDNTIADTSERMKQSLADLGRVEVFEKTSDEFGGFKEFLESKELETLWQLFLSDRYLHLDSPAPGAASFLRKLQTQGLDIFYLTGRHDEPGDSMRGGTVEWLTDHGFPDPENEGVELFMKPRRGADDRDYKNSLLEEKISFGIIPSNAVGIGDQPYDAEVYRKNGVKPVLINWMKLFPPKDLRRAAANVVVLEDWDGIAEELTNQSGSKL